MTNRTIKTFNRLYSFLLTGLFILSSVFRKFLPTHQPLLDQGWRSNRAVLWKVDQSKITIPTDARDVCRQSEEDTWVIKATVYLNNLISLQGMHYFPCHLQENEGWGPREWASHEVIEQGHKPCLQPTYICSSMWVNSATWANWKICVCVCDMCLNLP